MTQPPLLAMVDVVRAHRHRRTSLFRPAETTLALAGVSLEVAQGQRFGLVGESGSGKSTVLRLLAALDQPTSGTVSFEGRQISHRPERDLGFLRQDVQIVFQDPMASLDPRMRVGDIICEPLVAQGTSRDDQHSRRDELLEAVGLSTRAATRWPHQFSGGQRQRIAIARALSTRPRVLLADEPVSALDVSVRAQVLNLLTSLVDELNLTLVFVSHDLSVVQHVCDTIAVMRRGEIIERGSTETIATAPTRPYTQQLLRAVPHLQAALAGRGTAELAGADSDAADADDPSEVDSARADTPDRVDAGTNMAGAHDDRNTS